MGDGSHPDPWDELGAADDRHGRSGSTLEVAVEDQHQDKPREMHAASCNLLSPSTSYAPASSVIVLGLLLAPTLGLLLSAPATRPVAAPSPVAPASGPVAPAIEP